MSEFSDGRCFIEYILSQMRAAKFWSEVPARKYTISRAEQPGIMSRKNGLDFVLSPEEISAFTVRSIAVNGSPEALRVSIIRSEVMKRTENDVFGEKSVEWFRVNLLHEAGGQEHKSLFAQ